MAGNSKSSFDALLADKKAMDEAQRKQAEDQAARFAAQQAEEARLVAAAKARWPDIKRDLDALVSNLRERAADFGIQVELTTMPSLGAWVTPYKLNLKCRGRSVDIFFAMSRQDRVFFKIEERSMGPRNVSQADTNILGTTEELTMIVDSVSRSLLGLRTDDVPDKQRKR